MKVFYAGIFLAPGGIEGTLGATWNDTAIVDEAAFFRAAALTYFSRENRGVTFGFSVFKPFNSEGEALLFAATHFSSLTLQADLIVISDDGLYAVKLVGAVLTSFAPSALIGLSLQATYRFAGGQFVVETSPPTPPTVNSQVGSIALNTNDESRAIVFPTQFPSLPTVVECWVVPASGSSIKFISATPLFDTITISGFTAAIGYPIPEAGYRLFWEATLQT
jgi:hypothetical protein